MRNCFFTCQPSLMAFQKSHGCKHPGIRVIPSAPRGDKRNLPLERLPAPKKNAPKHPSKLRITQSLGPFGPKAFTPANAFKWRKNPALGRDRHVGLSVGLGSRHSRAWQPKSRASNWFGLVLWTGVPGWCHIYPLLEPRFQVNHQSKPRIQDCSSNKNTFGSERTDGMFEQNVSHQKR